MDLLWSPDDPVSPCEQTPYLCNGLWDGGSFRHYASRKDKCDWFPWSQEVFGLPPASMKRIHEPAGGSEVSEFLQTWFFFGVIAEFLALNEMEDGETFLDAQQRKHEIESIHHQFTIHKGGQTYLTGLPILGMKDLIWERAKLAPVLYDRLVYLGNVLHIVCSIMGDLQVDIAFEIRFSIASLGEILSTSLRVGTNLMQPPIQLPPVGYNWYNKFIEAGSPLEADMIKRGWCPSEIEYMRAEFRRLNTLNYLSQMRRPTGRARGNHSACTIHCCKAFYIDIETYKPKHVEPNCACGDAIVDAEMIVDILQKTSSFPVLRLTFDGSSLDTLDIQVETYSAGVEYIALSHVWADGLGNPRGNVLPKCQLARLAMLVDAINQSNGRLPDNRYAFWIDTVCCPVTLGPKLIALQRIADVYRNAAHVLVLDESLTMYKPQETAPAELLIRLFGCSPWPRRLWTLQEAALAKSLYIQFNGEAVPLTTLLVKLWQMGLQDVRLMCICNDMMDEYNQMQCFSQPETDGVRGRPAADMWQLQRALNFRTVTMPSDEALCIATLLGFDQAKVAIPEGGQTRMAALWKMMVETREDVTSFLLFLLEDTLDIIGFRWAPRTFLSSLVHDPFLKHESRVARFPVGATVPGKPKHERAQLTPFGLEVKLGGFYLTPEPHVLGQSLDPWSDLLYPTEDEVFFFHEERNTWYRLLDQYRSYKLSTWTPSEKKAYDRAKNNPLSRSIQTGNCVLLVDYNDENTTQFLACMGQVVNISTLDQRDLVSNPLGDTIVIHRERSVQVSILPNDEVTLYTAVRQVAKKAASHFLTAELAMLTPDDTDARKAKNAQIKALLLELMKEALASDPDLERIALERFGEDIGDFWYVLPAKLFSYDITANDAPSGQKWIVD